MRDFTVVPIKGHHVIKRGVSSHVIALVSQYLGLSRGALADLMGLDRGTATRLSSEGKNLPPHAADSLLRLLEIHDMAADVFDTPAGTATWLRTPHPLLENERPLDAAKTSYGAQAVKNVLMSAKYGGAV
ncbi:MAG: DUF2384 domain-containing protein [Aquabacterium sp.]|uniref:antitoxin Xre/MbcA/ParS toxin-binding domain-containing protein n=1 Tax=Aquabacterium sp. TaxID=1872578 RepID=UPI002717C9D8|nr:antitoxin Xre/MbcA/ParS toxin-binding domain-containing protein [Aquabacterium sp.]MDO9006072.1 DUF2384 domain-containing protein [Aquabacterium sp.]